MAKPPPRSTEERLVHMETAVTRMTDLLERVLAQFGMERELQLALSTTGRQLASAERRKTEALHKTTVLKVEQLQLKADLAHQTRSADSWHAEAKTAQKEIVRLTRALDLIEPDLLNIAEALAKRAADETSQMLRVAKSDISQLEQELEDTRQKLAQAGSQLEMLAQARNAEPEMLTGASEATLAEIQSATNTRRALIGYVIATIAKRHDVDPRLLDGASRTRPITQTRQEVWYVLRAVTSLSLIQLAELFQKNHTTVMHGIKTVRQRSRAAPTEYAWLEELIYLINPSRAVPHSAPQRIPKNRPPGGQLRSAQATLIEFLGRDDLDRTSPAVRELEEVLRSNVDQLEKSTHRPAQN